jgi:ubiquinone/menaquinone biosynthesis C-methylase UbiE
MSGPKPNYGIDAPNVIRNMAIIAVAGIVAGSFLIRQPGRFHGFGSAFLSIGFWFTLSASVMLWSSLAGKFRTRDKLLALIPWRGDEQVLDAGCGHGMMLIAAAKRLTTGHAIGVDIWSQIDQAKNSAAATRHNAELEGVANRIEIRDADIRQLPFDDNTFDVVVSSLVIHNLPTREEREKALAETRRVLKPGGRFAVIDISHNYATWLSANGFVIERRWMNLLFALPTRAILARKG